MKTWDKTELIEINGKFVEKKWAFPDLEGNQTAIMLRWVNGKWETSLWGAAIDGVGTVARGWDPGWVGNRPVITAQVDELMAEVEKGA